MNNIAICLEFLKQQKCYCLYLHRGDQKFSQSHQMGIHLLLDQTKFIYGVLNLKRYIKIQISSHIVQA